MQTTDSGAARRTNAEIAFVKRVLIVALIAIVITVMWLLSHVALLFFGALLIAMTLRALGGQFVKLGVSEMVGVLLATLLIAIVITGSVTLFGSEIADQAQILFDRLRSSIKSFGDRFDITSLRDLMKEISPASDIMGLIPSFLSWSISIGGALAALLFVLVAGFYLALDPRSYRDGLIKLVPPAYHANAIATVDDIGEALHRWIGGQFIVMIIVGVASGVGLWIVGVQSPLALGLLAGLANFVPYVGSIVAAAITLVIAGAQGFEYVASAGVVMLIVQQLESNVATPLIIGRAVSIAPATGLFAIAAMAVLFGPLGILFGYPLSIVADIAIRRLYIRDTLDEPVEILGDQAEKSSDAAR